MTEQHPLTDEIIDKIQDTANPCDPAYFGERHASPKEMQLAADWQLEQVIKWAKRNCWCWFEKSNQKKSFIDELQKAMRPRTQEDN